MEIPRKPAPIHRRFVYRPLSTPDFTRVLKLHPSTDPTSDLHCDLITIGREITDFEPVSYTWGPHDASSTLYHGSLEKLPISRNVDAMLRQLRQPTSERRLWIDAICINQDDNAEKAQQVDRMSRIYRDKHVLVWLGEGYWSGDEMLRVLGTLKDDAGFEVSTQDFHEPFDEAGKYMDLFYSDTAWVHEKMKSLPPYEAEENSDWDLAADQQPHKWSLLQLKLALVAFYERPWFYRRWILQEMAFAATGTIFCGGVRLPLDEFVLVSFVLMQRYSAGLGFQAHTREAIQSMFFLRSTYQHQKSTKIHGAAYLDRSNAMRPGKHRQPSNEEESFRDILWLLNNFWMTDCKDPRDRVYALLGLARDAKRKVRTIGPDRRDLMEITISYELDCATVYQNFAREYISNFGDSPGAFMLLQCAGAFEAQPKIKNKDWHTWVPDWTASRRYVPFVVKPGDIRVSVPTLRRTNTSYIRFADANQKMLRMTGIVKDDIERIVRFDWHPDQIDPAWRFAIKCVELAIGQLSSDIWNTVYDVVDLLTGDGLDLSSDHDRSKPWITQDAVDLTATSKTNANLALCAYLVDEVAARSNNGHNFVQKYGFTKVEYKPALRRVLEVCKGRAFGVTRTGLLAVCPEKTGDGDRIVALHGAMIPFVFRPRVRGRNVSTDLVYLSTYELVGDCWMGSPGRQEADRTDRGKEVEFVLR